MNIPSPLEHWLTKRRAEQTHRQLLLISGEQQWALAIAQHVLTTLKGENIWVGKDSPDAAGIQCSQYRQLLGQECDYLVYNAFSGTRASALMALSGIVRKQGLMIVLCPPLEDWHRFPDPERRARTSFGFDLAGGSHFIRWLVQKIRLDASVAVLTEKDFSGPLTPVTSVEDENSFTPCRTHHQALAVEDILHTVQGHRKRPLVLTADRGRGKSSALGIASASLIKDQGKHILVTAPSPATVERVFTHAALQLGITPDSPTEILTQAGSLRFIAPDALLQYRPKADLVLVDEAAAIPTPILETIVAHYSRVVFSTTQHGYEGSGRGFEIRFKRHLDRVTPQWRARHLTQPIRWLERDPLEAFWFETLLMTQPDNKAYQIENTEEIAFKSVPATELMQNPVIFTQAFQLLVDAHYQTTPDDLVRILDAQDLSLWLATRQQHVLAVALVATEGGEKLTQLAQDISGGSRRVQGHLTAQGLAMYLAEPNVACLNYLRVVRIATAPGYQGNGIASQLLTSISTRARQSGADVMSTSFGLNRALLGFWHKCGFQLVKLGHKKDAASGEHSGLMVKALSEDASARIPDWLNYFTDNLKYALPTVFSHLNPDLVADILRTIPVKQPLAHRHVSMLEQFVAGHRALDNCRLPIADALMRIAATEQQMKSASLLIALALQQQDMTHVARLTGYSGKRDVEQAARQAVAELLAGLSKP